MNVRCALFALLTLPTALLAEEKPKGSVLPFAWPFLEPQEMSYRGGNTQGSEVTLDSSPSEAWKNLMQSGLSAQERDRHAILAMAGRYRVSFQFVETMGFGDDYSPPQPYFSWGTEEVRVLEERDDFISLQHTLVMFFKTKDDKVKGPMVMKHWRQDWSWQDRDLHTYRGQSSWERERRKPKTVKGTWTQAVYQVDDSPRYEVVGRWNHDGGVSTWKSESCWRPLPRREFSMRDDYNVLDGQHAITITPTGWVHAQDNRKLLVEEKGSSRCLAAETGLNRYERIKEPELAGGADEYWTKTGAYWKEVRQEWSEVFAKHDRVQLAAKSEDQKLYQVHFGYAAELQGGADYDPAAARAHARKTIARFLVK